MKRIILLTLLFFIYSFPSLASLNGKGLVCECIGKNCSTLFSKDIRGQLFENNEIVSFSFWRTNDEVKLKNGTPMNYSTGDSYINWGDTNKKDLLAAYSSLDRKTLILDSHFIDDWKYQCKVYTKKRFMQIIFTWVHVFQKEYDLKLKDNKI